MPKPTTDKTRWYQRWQVKSTLLLVLVAAFLGGIIAAGRWSLEQLRGRERYDVRFADIACEPPVGMDRREFLEEVRSNARLPDTLHLLDDDLASTLSDAFTLHPWVEKVDAVRVASPREIAVRLIYRTPVLAIPLDKQVRAVDRHGVLLPSNAPTRGLPVYDGAAPAPKGTPGTRWGDPNVEAAARKQKGP